MKANNITNTITLTREEFNEVFEAIDKYRNDCDKLSDAISSIGDGYFIFDSAEHLVSVISSLLTKMTGATDDPTYGSDIDYYLYEDNPKIYVDEKEYPLENSDMLFDYLIDTFPEENKTRN